jgi:drug/metabolite transporter (DMT)-like permease
MAGTGERAALLALLAAAALAGGNGVGIRFSNRELYPLWGAGLRFALAAALLGAVMVGWRLPLPRGRALVGAVLYGVLNFATGFGVFYIALVDLHAGFGFILLALVPLVTLLLAIAWRQERFRPAAGAGLLLAVAGVAAMSQAPLRASVPVWTLVVALVSAVSLAQAAVVVRRFPRLHPVTMNAVGMAAGAAALLAGSAVLGESRALPRAPLTWAAIGYVVVAGSVLVFVLYLVVLRHWDASRAAYVFVLSPITAVALSAWLDGEPVGPSLVAGGVLVLAGVYLGALRPARSPVDTTPAPG